MWLVVFRFIEILEHRSDVIIIWRFRLYNLRRIRCEWLRLYVLLRMWNLQVFGSVHVMLIVAELMLMLMMRFRVIVFILGVICLVMYRLEMDFLFVTIWCYAEIGCDISLRLIRWKIEIFLHEEWWILGVLFNTRMIFLWLFGVIFRFFLWQEIFVCSD